jgi:PAS domain S-box-containing protein
MSLLTRVLLKRRAADAQSETLAFMADGGAMGAYMRGLDWSKSPLGPPQDWPQALRLAVRLMLNTGHPMYIWWGPELICFYNDAYSRSIGPERHSDSMGLPARTVWSEIWDVISPQIDHVMSGGGATWHENQLVPITRHGKLENVYWTYSFSPIDDDTAPDGVGGVLVICAETTQQVLSLERFSKELNERTLVHVAAERLASIVESSDDAIISKDLNSIIQSWNGGAARIFGYSEEEAIGQSVTMLIPEDSLDQEDLILSRIVKGERIDHFETVRKCKDGTLVYVSLTVSPVRNSSGTIIGASKVARDITETRKAREKQKLLMREMSHRIKNIFAVASGVVAASVKSAATPKELAGAIQSRLAALARAHDLTLQGDHEGVRAGNIPLAELLRTILSPYDDGLGNISITGPGIECGPGVATAFALLLHEFATNSVKYGALSDHAGSINVSWNAGETLVMTWTETGGGGAEPSADRQGFGSLLIKATVGGLGGTIERDWQPGGLVITLAVPRNRLEH